MRWTRPLAVLVLTPLVATLLTTPATGADPSGHQPVWDKGPGGERYVAFGDSFVSGPGIPTTRPGDCQRSNHNFPSLVARALDVQAFTDASCGGAVIGDLWEAQRDNPPQLDALGADTTLVTFGTLGGNDVNLVGTAAGCLTGDCAGTDGDAHHQAVEATRADLVAGIEETRLRAPNAVIAVVGYGTYLPPGGCPDNPALAGVTPAEADYVQGLIDHLSDVLEEVAAAEDALFVDMREIPGVLDHTACAAPEDQWIRALDPHGDGAPLHPSSAGMAAMADQVVGVVETAWADDPLHPIPPTIGLGHAQASVRVAATCRDGDLRLRVRGGRGLITRVEFGLGAKRLGVDRRAPWLLERRAARLDDTPGRPVARVTVREHGTSLSRPHRVARPSCLG